MESIASDSKCHTRELYLYSRLSNARAGLGEKPDFLRKIYGKCFDWLETSERGIEKESEENETFDPSNEVARSRQTSNTHRELANVCLTLGKDVIVSIKINIG